MNFQNLQIYYPRPPVKVDAGTAEPKWKLDSKVSETNASASMLKTMNASVDLSPLQEKQLVELKADGKGMPWKDIATALGKQPKDIGILKQRYRELTTTNSSAQVAKPNEDKKEKDERKDAGKGKWQERNSKHPTKEGFLGVRQGVELKPDEKYSSKEASACRPAFS